MPRHARRAMLVWALCLACVLGGSTAALGSAPTITHVNPNNGTVGGGTSVAITGTGFSTGSTVKFGSERAASVSVMSSTSILAISPAGAGTVGVAVVGSGGASASTPYDQFAYDPVPSGPWLGLNNNTVKYLGPANAFAQRDIVYDRSFELTAGQLPSELEKGYETAEFENRLKEDHQYGMTPVVVVEYRGYDRAGYAFKSDPEFPQDRTPAEAAQGRNSIGAYVAGFVSSASAILRLVNEKYPGMRVLLEPMNEPWGYTTPRFAGAEYANVIAQLLPAAREAHIPFDDIYVGATGRDCVFTGESREEECTTNGWVPAMYKAQPALQTEIQGWYLHPYGPPTGATYDDSEGIQSLPLVQGAMTSGQNNIIVSEVGYCANDVNQGKGCGGIGVETGATAASDLTKMLDNALYYRQAGWLRALIVYSRNDGGWAMQDFPELTLTQAGEALSAFAGSYGQSWWSVQPTPNPFASLFSELGGARGSFWREQAGGPSRGRSRSSNEPG